MPAKKIFGKKGLKQGVYGRSRVFGFSYAEPHFFVSWFVFIDVGWFILRCLRFIKSEVVDSIVKIDDDFFVFLIKKGQKRDFWAPVRKGRKSRFLGF